MVFIMVVLLLIFGAKRLPELGSGLGKGIREFKRSMRDINTEINRPDEAEQIRPPKPQQQVAPPPDAATHEDTGFNKR
jgi:sec-independent protein translocase protein TatA